LLMHHANTDAGRRQWAAMRARIKRWTNLCHWLSSTPAASFLRAWR
jgi:hypothetical protein